MMKSLTLELISPAQRTRRWQKGLRMPQLSVPVLAALTPSDVDVIVTEEEIEEVTYRSNVDLVGISFMTATAPRAYEIADEYRRRGVKVVLGGIHASVLPKEAINHADAVVIGEAENVWKSLIKDLKGNKLRRFYKSNEPANLNGMPVPRRDLLKKGMTFSPYSIQTTRGCPFSCDFCSVTAFFGGTFRCRPVEEVIREVEISKKKNWIFVDDNIIGKQDYAKRLFRELIPLKINWVGQSSLMLARNDELLKLAVESGCRGLFIGFESISSQSLKSVHKGFNKAEYYEDSIKKLHDHGILIQASFIFGFDYDDKHVFEKTVAFLKRNKVGVANFPILTPLPGTKLCEKMEREGRIIDRDWSRYDCAHVVFRPKLMTPQELKDGSEWACREFYSCTSILSRFVANRHHPLLYPVMNLSYRAKSKKHLRGKIHALSKDKLREFLREYRLSQKDILRTLKCPVGQKNA